METVPFTASVRRQNGKVVFVERNVIERQLYSLLLIPTAAPGLFALFFLVFPQPELLLIEGALRIKLIVLTAVCLLISAVFAWLYLRARRQARELEVDFNTRVARLKFKTGRNATVRHTTPLQDGRLIICNAEVRLSKNKREGLPAQALAFLTQDWRFVIALHPELECIEEFVNGDRWPREVEVERSDETIRGRANIDFLSFIPLRRMYRRIRGKR